MESEDYEDFNEDSDLETDGNYDMGDSKPTSGSTSSSRQTQEEEGTFEACYGDEAGCHQRWTECQKNPGHKEFIPARKFTVDHLPVEYQDEMIVELIQTLSDITVCLNIKNISSQRPDDDQYAAKRGRNIPRTGSGWVWRVTFYSQRNVRKKGCPCKECRGFAYGQRQWAAIDIYTAKHLVYDESEGANTRCFFFYDDADTSIYQVPSINGAIRVATVPDADTCRLTYITHDLALANRLKDKWRQYRDLHTSVGEKYNTVDESDQANSEQDSAAYSNDHNLTVIVSHPHGYSKQISVGLYKERKEMDYSDVHTKYYYTTPTCEGSSGAPVYILGRWWWWGCDHPHSGHSKTDNELNYSGVALY